MNLAMQHATIPPTGIEMFAVVDEIGEALLKYPIEIQTEHVLHGGMYSRTLRLNTGEVACGVLIKIPTMLIVVGRTAVFTGAGWIELEGTHIIPASAGRKQIVIAREPTSYTMIFPTKAQTVEEAEAEFTDEAHRLMSRRMDSDTITITGE